MVRLLLILALALPAASQPPDPDLARALSAHKAGSLDEAAAAYRHFLAKHPNSVEARSNLGAVLARQGRYAAAITEYRRALQLAPANTGIALNLALAHYKSGDIPQAARELAKLQNTPQATLLLADCWLQMGEYSRVIQLLTPYQRKAPDDLAVAYLLGAALVRNRQVEEGQKVLDKIFAKGESAEAHLLLGTAKLNTADYSGALAEFAKAVELNPALPSVQSYYGQTLMATGDSARAAAAFRAELERNPNDFLANLNLAVILKQDGELDNARRYLARALRVRPGDLGVRYQIASILVLETKTEEARRELESILAEAPSFTEAHVSLATVYYRLKRKADGDRERAMVQKLNAEAQARQPKGEAMDASAKSP